ncbi:transketolase [Candidatus Shapirobacteria bacterium CG_4_8_14_3_um_filter_35_11]|uniref:Transketolase n=3 Tax=Candidatus Shapironibacteriota TaxID=1752721 RepID=A0A2M7BPQ6_9BACT|nr:MAG: transketolase [Candidatus Shapirobacteria bacterium CG03_land_8_20_14_0_80_35_14]PJC80944.1 MAG: transketolase [Candidatus Shapirobacteria bacterium CG_4_8_14_3_um_filter_35_11]
MKIKNYNSNSMRSAFADTLFDLAKDDPNLYVVSVGLRPSVLMDKFAQHYKTHFIECGVAENNAAGISAGLAKSGKNVFLCTYACFSPGINLATIKQSICENNLSVKIIGYHGGLLTGELGASHQMLEDIALMRSLPTMEVFAPLDAIETVKMTKVLAKSSKPTYMRLVRPDSPEAYPHKKGFTIGKSEILESGSDVTILGYGPILTQALNLEISNWKLEIINCSSIKPIDEKTILKSIKKTGRCLVVEDHQMAGGLGEAVATLILKSGLKCKFTQIGVDNQFGRSSLDPLDLYRLYGLSTTDIITKINYLMSKK